MNREAIKYLKSKDEKLSKVIDFVGDLELSENKDLYKEISYHILGQQISVIVQDTIWDRLLKAVKPFTPENVIKYGADKLRKLGMSNRKAETLVSLAEKIKSGELDFSKLSQMDNEEAISYLTKHKGIGHWTAEMLLMFGLGREDVFTKTDIALNRGLKRLYQKEELTKEDFDYFKNLFSPYGTLACLYIWCIGEEKNEGILEFVDEINKKELKQQF